MRTIYETIFDIDNNIDNVDESIIEKFLEENYTGVFVISNKLNKNNKYDVKYISNVELKNKDIKSLTNNMFVFTDVDGNFEINGAQYISDLEGLPSDIKGCLAIYNCPNLKSLKGMSKAVGKIYIDSCPSLKSIDYMPTTIYGDVEYHKSECYEHDDIYIENCKNLGAMPAIKSYKKSLALRLFDCPARSLKDIPNANVYNSWIYLN